MSSLGEFLSECGYGWEGDEILAIQMQVAEWLHQSASESTQRHSRTHRCVSEDEGYGYCCLYVMSKKITDKEK